MRRESDAPVIGRMLRALSAPNALIGLSVVEGLVLGFGLEVCFWEARYRLIMLLGAAGGLGIGLLGRAGLEAWDRTKAKNRDAWLQIWGLAAGPALAAFAVWFLWRVLPLIKEELKYRI